MRSNQTDDFDRDAEEQSEARVVNVTDEVCRFEVAQGPGSKPRRYKLEPFGRADSGVYLQMGYTIETKGVGRKMIAPTVEQLTEREVYPGGPRLPMVASEADGRAAAARKAWLVAMATKGKTKLPTIVLQDTDGNRVEAELARAPAPGPTRPADFHGEVEDQGGAPVDVDPDEDPANTPDPTALPVVPAATIPTPMRKSAPRGRKAG
jgi:hypothetical protein